MLFTSPTRGRTAAAPPPCVVLARIAAILAGALLLSGCASSDGAPTDPGASDQDGGIFCSISQKRLTFVLNKDGIPALTNPELVGADDAGAAYLKPTDRVIGLDLGDEFVAVPLNILWYHEIVNLDRAGLKLAVTYCPLTGSSLVFDRAAVGGAELGVSGLLLDNNLIMYDRNETASLWPQMAPAAVCGPRARSRTRLEMFPSAEMTWKGWRGVHPETRVVSSDTGFRRRYDVNPTGDYEDLDNQDIFFPLSEVDTRRPLKERVLGIPQGLDGGIAFPFGEMASAARRAIPTRVTAGPLVVFWDRDAVAAIAYFTAVGGRTLTFEVADGRYVDLETGSTWALDGRATAGPLTGERLRPLPEAYVAFWFAWAHFQPESFPWSSLGR